MSSNGDDDEEEVFKKKNETNESNDDDDDDNEPVVPVGGDAKPPPSNKDGTRVKAAHDHETIDTIVTHGMNDITSAKKAPITPSERVAPNVDRSPSSSPTPPLAPPPPPPPSAVAAAAAAAASETEAAFAKMSTNNTRPRSTNASPVLTNRKHNRKISWGLTTIGVPPAQPTQPPPAEGQTHQQQAQAQAQQHAPHQHQHHRRRLSSMSSAAGIGGGVGVGGAHRHTSTIINTRVLNQVNPLEQEAETHIISSLEEMEARTHQEREGAAPDILEFVPREYESVFLDELHSTFNNNTNAAAADAASSSSAGHAAAGDGSVGNQSSVQMNAKLQQPPPPTPQARRPDRRQQHRRTMTVEQDLFSLTNALNALHRPPPDNNKSKAEKAAANNNNNVANKAENISPDQAVGSADLLAANAALLFRNQQSQKVVVNEDGHLVQETRSEDEQDSVKQNARPSSIKEDGAAATATTMNPPGSTEAAPNNNSQPDETEQDSIDDDGPIHPVSSMSVDVEGGGGDEEESDESDTLAGTGFLPSPVVESPQSPSSGRTGAGSSTTTRRKAVMVWLRERSAVMRDFIKAQRVTAITSICLMVPLIGIAFILFYLCGNPPTGIISLAESTSETLINEQGIEVDPKQPSHSWWLLFTARQLVTFALARASEVIVIDIFCLRFRWINLLKSPLLTLLFVQSRGWPFRSAAWAIFDLMLVHGPGVFARHWLFYQESLKIFNEANPSGQVTSEKLYTQIIILCLMIGLSTSLKRVFVGYMQGKRVFATYGEEVAYVMRKVLLISQVGYLAREIEMKALTARNDDDSFFREDDIWEKVEQFVQPCVSDDEASKGGTAAGDQGLDTVGREGLTGSFSQSQKMKIIEVLGEWENPHENGLAEVQNTISVTSILQFRQSLAFFDVRDMFGHCFGPTDTRELCIESSEDVYARLLYRSNRAETLSFHVFAMLALNSDGTLKQKKIKELIKIFRPQRDGSLSKLDFVKSVDTVYKRVKLLRASIKKTQRLDQAVERIFNIGFFVIVGVIALAVVGIDPMALFLSLSSIILAFAFMIGSASAKYFEGLLFILVRKPYGIGDRVFFNPPGEETSMDGSPGWFVRDITLYHTVLVFSKTNECCTVSNGSLAGLRVINAARSPKGVIHVFLKFGTDVPWSRIQVFEKSLRAFVKSRPREWLGLNGFRTTRVECDLGFHEMVAVLQHRESWQNVGSLLVSKAEVTAFCHELQKKMDMRYKSPPLPIDLTLNKRNADDKQAIVATLGGIIDSSAGVSIGETDASYHADSHADFDSVAKLFGQRE